MHPIIVDAKKVVKYMLSSFKFLSSPCCGRPEEPAILISSFAVTNACAAVMKAGPDSIFALFVSLPPRMYGMQRTQFDHKRFDYVKLVQISSVVYSEDARFVTTLP